MISGAAGLLGLNHCLAVALAGGMPVMLDSDDKRLESAATLMEEQGVEFLKFNANTADENSVREVASIVREKVGPVFGIVNNVARNPPMDNLVEGFGRLDSYELADWNRDHEVALGSAFVMSKFFGPHLEERGEGSIVNVASDLALISPDQRLYMDDSLVDRAQSKKPMAYSSSKSAVLGISRYLATYWSPLPIRSNALVPGSVLSNQSKTLQERLRDRIPLNRLATQDEYQGALIFLLSDASRYMNGAILTLDGGRSVW